MYRLFTLLTTFFGGGRLVCHRILHLPFVGLLAFSLTSTLFSCGISPQPNPSPTSGSESRCH